MPGTSYRFYSLARDNAGNVEAAPAVADAATTVRSQITLSSLTLDPAVVQGGQLISEFRFRGPSGNVAAPNVSGAPESSHIADGNRIGQPPSAGSVAAADGDTIEPQPGVGTRDLSSEANNEFIEFYNNTDSDLTVRVNDGSDGWALVASDGSVRFIIPNGTMIPARGHFLAVNSLGYGLGNYPAGHSGGVTAFAAGDLTYDVDILDGGGIALFRTSNASGFNEANRLDAVGYGTSPALYREGGGFPNPPSGEATGIEYSFLRDLRTGTPKDTGDNASDFIGISTNGAATTAGQYLGAPGPENLSSPILRLNVYVDRIDQQVAVGSAPNRVRRACNNNAEECDPLRSALGTMSMRRRVVNGTGAPITRLRFRIRQITTFTSPPVSGQADLRPISSGDITVMLTNGNQVPVQGTVIQEPPSQQTFGGGWNTIWAPTGTISLESPLAPNAYIDVQFLMGHCDAVLSIKW